MKNKVNRSGCPISSMLDIFGDKWSLLIIRDMVFSDKNTYGDFLKSDEKIATNILAARLLTLEESGVIQKLEHPGSKAKVLYMLTEKGIDLLPVLLEIQFWADKHLTVLPEIKVFLKEAKKDREKFIKTLSRQLKGRLSSTGNGK
ncbi:helix-turn-helix transcriptional regulator [Flavobacterium psychroterrae]|uniref:Helix-turn-helix transcriptional regulator n=1 Tax=Flavobacterium psychroterrae TaxID=2133767 RepID=A0ABS5PGH1_9FLAO|nr:helix-turn-helix domain-containing protein [Flavobacterium psychroterrae]MBS7233387.1 helix-turn-helix transcriptional regulator [Flavobacterium psychroterrae]